MVINQLPRPRNFCKTLWDVQWHQFNEVTTIKQRQNKLQDAQIESDLQIIYEN